jgi:hypothetical protein
MAGLKCCASTRSVGIKIFPFQLSRRTQPPVGDYDARDVDRGRRIIDRLRALNWKFIHLVRDDLFAQTVSFMRANQTGIWHTAVGADRSVDVRVRLNVREFEKHLNVFVIFRACEAKVLGDMEMLRLTYESTLEIPEMHQGTAGKAFGFLGLSSVPVSSRFARLYVDPLESQVENAEEIMRAAERLGVKPISATSAP